MQLHCVTKLYVMLPWGVGGWRWALCSLYLSSVYRFEIKHATEFRYTHTPAKVDCGRATMFSSFTLNYVSRTREGKGKGNGKKELGFGFWLGTVVEKDEDIFLPSLSFFIKIKNEVYIKSAKKIVFSMVRLMFLVL